MDGQEAVQQEPGQPQLEQYQGSERPHHSAEDFIAVPSDYQQDQQSGGPGSESPQAQQPPSWTRSSEANGDVPVDAGAPPSSNGTDAMEVAPPMPTDGSNQQTLELPGPPSLPNGMTSQEDAGTPGSSCRETTPSVPGPPPRRRHRWGDQIGPDGQPIPGTGTPLEALDLPLTPASSELPGMSQADREREERKRKRRSRWEEPEVSQAIVPVQTTGGQLVLGKFPKEVLLANGMKVCLPAHIIGEASHSDPKLKSLHDELTELTRKLNNGDYDIPPEGQRSPSPEPVYDKNGVRQNTREIRYRDRMLDKKHKVIEDLIKEDPNFKPPADYKPRKFHRKISIPQDKYPGYNFIGLIIGPRGNTQKRMQKETNTKIAIRGRGSVKEGAMRDPKYDYGEEEELHVLITGDTQDDVERAGAMIEQLLEPMDETLNEHKRLQLRELAALNGTLKDEVACTFCGEATHRSTECPKQQQLELYQLPTDMKAKVDELYARDVARVHGAGAVAAEDDYKKFLRDLGGAPPPELMGQDPSQAASLLRPSRAPHQHPGSEMPDECKLYIGNVPPSFNDAMLKAVFEPFGNVVAAAVVMDPGTNVPRGYGFVTMASGAEAKACIDGMHGRVVDGRPLAVRLRGDKSRQGPGSAPLEYPVDESKLYVGGLPTTFVEPQLRELFAPFGAVLEVRVITDRATGLSRGYAFVGLANPDQARAAMAALTGHKLDGRSITVKVAGKKDSGGPGHGGDSHGPRAMVPGGPSRPMGPAMAAPPPPQAAPGAYPPPHAAYPPPHGAYPPPGAPPTPYYAPPPGAYPPPYGAPAPHGYAAPPPAAYGYAAPPPGMYATAAAAAVPNPYAAYAYPPPAAMAAVPGQPPLPGYPPMPAQQPPLPGSEYSAAPPLPADPYGVAPPPPPDSTAPAAPPPPPAPDQQSEYDRFMQDLQKTFS